MKNTQRSVWTAPTELKLSNGIRIVSDYVNTVDSCALGIWVKAGTRDEPRGRSGIAHFVEHTSFRRTASRSTSKISRDFENRGAYANAYTTKEETCYYVRTLRDHLHDVASTLTDVVVNPVFHDADIEKERNIIIEELRSYEDEPEEHIFDLGERQLFPSHSIGSSIVGTITDVERLRRADLARFHNKFYNAANMVIAISGNHDIDALAEHIETLTSELTFKRKLQARKAPLHGKSSHAEHRKQMQQAHLLWQVPTTGYHHADTYALQILNVVLGDGMSSRLNVKLRETRGLAYSVYSQLQLFMDCGIMAIYAGIDEAQRTSVERHVTGILSDLADQGITASERKRALAQLRASKLMSLESLTSRMTLLGKGVMEEGQPEDPIASIEALESVTLADVHHVSQQYCNPARWSTTCLLPAG
ncbi:MAG: insulinase family protein [Ignavibacteria bacterium]|nr:insulinase family protein [Ignavibacteria bacterium]